MAVEFGYWPIAVLSDCGPFMALKPKAVSAMASRVANLVRMTAPQVLWQQEVMPRDGVLQKCCLRGWAVSVQSPRTLPSAAAAIPSPAVQITVDVPEWPPWRNHLCS